MAETNKKFRNSKKVKKNTVKLTKAEYRRLFKGLTDEETELVLRSSHNCSYK